MVFGLNDGGRYTFGEFTFDAADNSLRRGDAILPLAPKPLDLLRHFIANQGKLLSKTELMNELWPDSFVEESNLAVTIRQLRKTLADDAHNPRYIETVARQGYRFIAEVRRINVVAVADNLSVGGERSTRYLLPFAVVAGLLLIASISLGSLYLRNGRSHAAPILAMPFAAEKLSTSGRVQSAAISRDGTKFVYTVSSGGRESVWLRETASENNVEIIPPSDDDYFNFDFSPDGNTLYFTRGPRSISDEADLFSVSIFGGIPQKIVSNTRGWISVSPDGTLVSFVRCAFREKENCSLWTAAASDGKREKMLASRPRPLRIADNEISPDGKSVVFAVGQSENAGTDFGLMSVDLETGVERQLTDEKFFDIKSLEVLPGNDGILLTGSRGSTVEFRVWRVSYTDGSVQPLTRDAASYSEISLDDSGSRMVATQVTSDFRVIRSNLSKLDEKATLVEAAGRFAIDDAGGIVYQSGSTGDIDIWRMNADGSGQRQLTNVTGDDWLPVTPRDSSEVYFCSNRSGGMQVWRMKSDGSEQQQVTSKNGGMPLFADDRWIYYQHGIDRTLWRVATDALTEEAVLQRKPFRGGFAFSPSGTRAAFIDMRTKPVLVILSIPDGSELASFELAGGKGRIEIGWLQDETSVAYSISDLEGGTNTLWVQPTDGSPARRMADLGSEEIVFLAFPPGNESIAYVQGRWKHDVVMLSGLQ